jgi:hypothetical protein
VHGHSDCELPSPTDSAVTQDFLARRAEGWNNLCVIQIAPVEGRNAKPPDRGTTWRSLNSVHIHPLLRPREKTTGEEESRAGRGAWQHRGERMCRGDFHWRWTAAKSVPSRRGKEETEAGRRDARTAVPVQRRTDTAELSVPHTHTNVMCSAPTGRVILVIALPLGCNFA